MKQRKSLLYLAQGGVIAALYTALTVVLQPISFGPVQCRLSEVLTILPVYTPAAIPGLTIGCFLSNLISLGTNPAGGWDLLFGPLATGAAAILSYCLRNVRIKKLPLAATVPPIVLNAVIVGAELYIVYGGFPWYVHMALVGAGQAVACFLGGLLLAITLQKTGLSRRL